jgi:hypothetical protein
MIYVWVKYHGESQWEPHTSFSDEDPNVGTTITTEAQDEILDLREHGHKAKTGVAF